jgi:hypothetical protein
MRTATFAIVLAMVTQCVLGQSSESTTTPLKVPDSATAVSIAEKRLAGIYGKKVIEAERPFTASLSEGIWHVGGTLYCGKDNRTSGPGECLGGVAMADIRQRDGKVLRTGHGK